MHNGNLGTGQRQESETLNSYIKIKVPAKTVATLHKMYNLNQFGNLYLEAQLNWYKALQAKCFWISSGTGAKGATEMRF